jgi:N-glycosylase/DNA lyase
LNELLKCKLGFHAKYLKGVAQSLIDSDLARRIYDMEEDKARKELVKLHGVGNKIADCVLIYSLGFDNVTPLDVWGKRICTDIYNCNPKMKYEEMRAWIDKYFEGYAGWAGQFLFEYIRNL